MSKNTNFKREIFSLFFIFMILKIGIKRKIKKEIKLKKQTKM